MATPLPKLVLATNNKHKVKEIRSILKKAGLQVRLLTLAAFPPFPPVVENLPTIEGNAIKKAKEVAKKTGCWALSDDTGLFIDALGGRPGVYSARFAGPKCSFVDNNAKVLRLMKKIPVRRRGADFRCIAALASPTGKVFLAKGRIRGRIAQGMMGKDGFGYDPIFFVPAERKTFAEMGARRKNEISHRAKAFSKVPALLKKIYSRLKA